MIRLSCILWYYYSSLRNKTAVRHQTDPLDESRYSQATTQIGSFRSNSGLVNSHSLSMTRKPKSIDDYLRGLDNDKRAALEKLRKAIRAEIGRASCREREEIKVVR